MSFVSICSTFLIQEKMESQMTSNNSKMLKSKMPEGLGLEISHHPLTMKSVVNLIIALDRLKGSSSSSSSETLLSTEFRDENLLNIMMDTVVEGKCRGTCNKGWIIAIVFFFKLEAKMICPPRRANSVGVLLSSTFTRQVQEKQPDRLQRDRQREEEPGQGPKQHGAPSRHAAGRLRMSQR